MPTLLIYDLAQLSTLVRLRTDVVFLAFAAWANWVSYSDNLFDYESSVSFTLEEYKYDKYNQNTIALHDCIVDFYIRAMRYIIRDYELLSPYYVTYELIDKTTLCLRLYFTQSTIKPEN